MSDEASLIQERLDDLSLTMFNGVLEVSRVSGDEGRKDDKCHVAASELGIKLGTVLHEIEEAIGNLLVIQLPTADRCQQIDTVKVTQSRVRELQSEYERVKIELDTLVSEAENMSIKLQSAFTYHVKKI
ncbi:hypothetical protein NSK_008649 [Nannochloropsis salina CCMP1776]|uniref:Uncharacterized protein n=1 Tax=Nannochloropsis salina CCMP1776 TaxID=1027361 RepID=A0A4D9CLV8_9STRA|nr:hypothetical protein NSK_008649 [Nannochloropsis salina CCMP1776]|eukprot:TFJ80092.1 hypothetical protein NSK_008649 [Nannochloropsis salina CCMP1776]